MEEEKYKNIINILRSAPRVIAREGFEARLYARIRQMESDKKNIKSGATDKGIFGKYKINLKPYLVPAAGVSMIILISLVVYYLFFTSATEKINGELTAKSDSIRNVQLNIYMSDREFSSVDSISNNLTVSSPPVTFRDDNFKNDTKVDNKQSADIDTEIPTAPLMYNESDAQSERSGEYKLSAEEDSSDKIKSEENIAVDTAKLKKSFALPRSKIPEKDSLGSEIKTGDSLDNKNLKIREK